MKKIIVFFRKHWKITLITLSVVVLGAVMVSSCIDHPIINNYNENSGPIETQTFIQQKLDTLKK